MIGSLMRPFSALAALPLASLVRRAPARLLARCAAALPGRKMTLTNDSLGVHGAPARRVEDGR
jgi:hypothetical protein